MASKNSSPGVYMTEKDLTFSVETVGVTTLGLVGETKKGPAFQPFFVKSYDEFKTFFGGTSPEKFKGTQIPKYELPYIAKSYLTQSNQLYVTRVLGLSGYNAGDAWLIKTIGACDVDTFYKRISIKDYKLTPHTLFVELDGDDLFWVNPSTSAVTTTTLAEKTIEFVGEHVDQTIFTTTFETFFSQIADNLTKVAYWGTIPEDELPELTPHNLYNLPIGYQNTQEEQHWLQTYFAYNDLTDVLDGKAFFISAVQTDASHYTITLTVLEYACDPIQDFHNRVVSIIRSAATYQGDELVRDVTGSSGLTISNVSEVNPYASFTLTAIDQLGTNFTYTIGLDRNEKNFITNVIGHANNERNSVVWVEEVYDKSLDYGYKTGKIKCLKPVLEHSTNYSNYETSFQTPSTPYFVSELRGGVTIELFRFLTISDGHDANTEIKISIANVDLGKKTFDVYVRAFGDEDKKPIILERYLNCSMNPVLDNFVGRKIGTVDGQYDLISRYCMIEIAENAPIDAVPAGFNGYTFKGSNLAIVPTVPYKTKYYAPGDPVYTPFLEPSVTSSGDKIKKIYLGITTSEFGVDGDLLRFKGKPDVIDDWSNVTNGFHMDIDADATKYSVGVGTFTKAEVIDANKDHPYHEMTTRKFTAVFAGGFDGWDIFRDYRTNMDDYKIGRTGFINGGFENFTHEELNEVFGTSDYYAYLMGIKSYINPETVSINIFATPGIDVLNNTDLVRETIDMIEEERKDCIYLPTLPDMNLLADSPADTDAYLYPDDIVQELEATEIDSSYAAVFYPWIQILDTENNMNTFIPPTAEVIRNLALTDNVAQPWYATAGNSRGLVNAKRTRIKIGQEQRDTLYDGRINALATFPDVNVVIWGNKNMQIADTALNRLNVKRLLLQAQKLIQSVSKRLLFEPNDERVRSEFQSLVNPILDNIRKERGLYDFRIKVSDDAADLDRNTLSGKIYLKPTRTLEYIELEFNITPTSVSFDSIS